MKFSCKKELSVITWPVTVEPVNEITGTSGCLTMAAPALGPVPITKLTTPGGKPTVIDQDMTH